MEFTRKALLTLALCSLGTAAAQTAAELVTVTAIQSTLAGTQGVRVPTGTSFVTNPAHAARLAPALLGAEAARFTTPQLYTARGLAMKLADTYILQLTGNAAAAGYFAVGTRTLKVGADTWTRTNFENDEGRTMILLVTKRADGVYFLTATGK